MTTAWQVKHRGPRRPVSAPLLAPTTASRISRGVAGRVPTAECLSIAPRNMPSAPSTSSDVATASFDALQRSWRQCQDALLGTGRRRRRSRKCRCWPPSTRRRAFAPYSTTKSPNASSRRRQNRLPKNSERLRFDFAHRMLCLQRKSASQTGVAAGTPLAGNRACARPSNGR